jgi:hypothetical protein
VSYTRKDFMAVHVPLSNTGVTAKIEYRDAASVFEYGWSLERRKHTAYAVAAVRSGGKTRNIYLHRYIMEADKGDLIDHINNDGLDCRRQNLRFSNKSINALNKPRGEKFIGVKRSGSGWAAYFGTHGKQQHIGTFSTAEQAATERDRVAIAVHGKHARLNFPATK